MSSRSMILDDPPAPRTGRWTQTLALLTDAYRDLQSRKLFWFTLVLSGLVAGVFGAVGIDPEGVTLFGKRLTGLPFNSVLISPADFFKLIFTTIAIPAWLGYFATALALFSLAGVFPDMIGNGSIDLYLSRPIGRLRLFLSKYAFALLFAALQVLLFSVVSFLVIGIRGGAWEFGIFLAVPLVTLLFSYLYCFCVLIGLWTRSTLASILFTALFWGLLNALQVADIAMTEYATGADQRVVQQRRVIDANQEWIDRNAALPPEQRGNMTAFEFQRDKQKEALPGFEQNAADVRWWQQLIVQVKTPLPKTNETVQLMNRWLLRPGVLDAVEENERRRREESRARRGITTRPRQSAEDFINTPEAQEQYEKDFTQRKVGWIVGTSLGYELVILSLAAWVFCRRDY